MYLRAATTAILLLSGVSLVHPAPADSTGGDLEKSFSETIHPFVENYCVKCHSGEKPKGHFDISPYSKMDAVVSDFSHWTDVLDKLTSKDMPPENAKAQPSDEDREKVIAWIKNVRIAEAKRNAGDPGVVLARRLSNSEYNYSIRDLTGVDIQPAKEFPVDPANPEGFDNTGESLAMSPALMNKYLQAAREVANHMVFKPDSLAFASHLMLAETDRDKYCVNEIVEFYHQQDTDYADYFSAAWQFKHRAALGKPKATLPEIAAANKVSAKYLNTIWRTLEEKEEVGPVAKLQAMWRALPEPKGNQPDVAKDGCKQMRDYVVQLRAKLEPRFMNLAVKGISASSQPFLMWKNRQYASHRMTYDRAALQIDGKLQSHNDTTNEDGTGEFGPGATRPVNNKPGDPDLFVPAVERVKYEASFAKFCAVFPDNFYIEERGRNYLDKTKDRGRYLSAGFHNLMGYFRDDQPLYKLVLDEKQQGELDAMWRDLDFVALGCTRTYVQFYFNESGEARGTSRESEGPRPADKEVTSEEMIRQVEGNYLSRARASSNEVAIKAIENHFDYVNATIRWVEKTEIDCEVKHLADLEKFAERAYRRPVTTAERADFKNYYASLRKETGLSHEEAMRDLLTYVLMSPDFCYRIDLVEAGEAKTAGRSGITKVSSGEVQESGVPSRVNVRPLSDYALASRLSYFLWASIPDEELLSHAAKGDLHKPEVITAQARRMLKDSRVRDFAVEFGGNWLDFRRFEQINTVDRERFPSFNNDLREAMFEEPIEFIQHLATENGSILDCLYGDYTYVNPVLAKHYGMPEPKSDEWVRVDGTSKYSRGGLLPMSVFLTQNAPGLRTSPVKRGYWVVRRVLGEKIPPPPAVVPELPRDEAKMDLPLRQMLARHREDPSCAACHARFDSFGLVFEGFGPIGDRRTKDLAGRDVDASANFPGNVEKVGLEGLRNYIHEHRENDFVDNLCRKMLAYALNRSLIITDDFTIEQMHEKLVKNGYHFDTLVETVVTSPQFLNKRAPETSIAQN